MAREGKFGEGVEVVHPLEMAILPEGVEGKGFYTRDQRGRVD